MKIPITLQNVRARQPFQITLVESSLPSEKQQMLQVFTILQSSENSWFSNQIEKSAISLQTHLFSARCHNIHADVQLDQKSLSKCD